MERVASDLRDYTGKLKLTNNSKGETPKMKIGTINKNYRLATVALATGLLGLTAYALVSPEVSEASASVVTAIGGSGNTLTVSGAGTVDLALSPTAGGSFAMGLEALSITTDADGYDFYISTNENTTSLTHTNGTDTLSATGHSYSQTPSDIDTNTWGFAVPASYKNASGTTVTNGSLVVSGFGNVDNGFSAVPEEFALEGSTKWASIPEKGSPLRVQHKQTSASNENLGIFYAAKANTGQSAGIYSGDVLYTVLANAPSSMEASITPGTIGNLGGGNTLTATLGLKTAASDAIKNNSTITIGDKACTVTGAGNDASGNLYLTCTDQKQVVTGNYDVTITVSDGSNSYGTYYISKGVEYRSIVSPQIQWITPTEIYNADPTPKTFRIQTDITTDTTLSTATVKVGTNTCSNPAVTAIDGTYQITCAAPTNLAPQEYQVTIALANGGETLVDLNTYVTYSGTATIFGASSMQDLTAANCAATPTPGAAVKTTEAHTMAEITYDANDKAEQIPTTNPLTDERDDQTYVVKKLADGNCWMAENLRFGSTTTNNQRAWDSTTDPSLTATTSAGATVMAGLNNAHIITVNSGAKGADDSTAFSDVNEYYQNPYIAIYDANTEDNVSGTGTKFGVLYNYCAATGGTACTASGSTPTVDGSICPKNWDLPGFDAQVGTAQGTNPSYNNLTAAYSITVNTAQGVTDITSAPLSFPRAGGFYDGGLYSRSSSGDGNYWSSRPNGGTNAYVLYFYGAQNIGQGVNTRRIGRSVRCVVSGQQGS